MKRVSIPGSSFRFMLAIWNSYSKSLTARSPRSTVFTPSSCANLTRRPENVFTLTRESPSTASLSRSTRSSMLKTASLAGFLSTATIRPSNIFIQRGLKMFGVLGRVLEHRDDQAVEHLQSALDDAQVPVGRRVEGARVQGDPRRGHLIGILRKSRGEVKSVRQATQTCTRQRA